MQICNVGIGEDTSGVSPANPEAIVISTSFVIELAQWIQQGERCTMDCENQAKNARSCNCSYPGCPRHEICCECIAYHRGMSQLPACYFTAAEERTYDRSISYFVSSRR